MAKRKRKQAQRIYTRHQGGTTRYWGDFRNYAAEGGKRE